MCSSRKYPYPPPPTEGIGNSGGVGGSKAYKFPERGGGGFDTMNFFFPDRSQYYFRTVVRKVSLFAFRFSSRGRKKK